MRAAVQIDDAVEAADLVLVGIKFAVKIEEITSSEAASYIYLYELGGSSGLNQRFFRRRAVDLP